MTPSHLYNIYNLHISSTVLDSKHSLVILNLATSSYREIQQVSHSMGQPPNPALLIGLQLTPVSSICFCLQRALKSHSLQQGQRWKNKSLHTQESKRFTQRMWRSSTWLFALEMTDLNKSSPSFPSSELVFVSQRKSRGGIWNTSEGGREGGCQL